MTAPECVEDPTIVACTDEATGRQYDDLPPVADEAPAADVAVTVEVGTAEPAPMLAATGVPTCPYLAAALLLIAAGAWLRRWAA